MRTKASKQADAECVVMVRPCEPTQLWWLTRLYVYMRIRTASTVQAWRWPHLSYTPIMPTCQTRAREINK